MAEEVIFDDAKKKGKKGQGGAAGDSKSTSTASFSKSSSIPEDERIDWFNINLLDEFIKTSLELFGDPNDPRVQAVLKSKNDVQTKIDPEIAFELYKKSNYKGTRRFQDASYERLLC